MTIDIILLMLGFALFCISTPRAINRERAQDQVRADRWRALQVLSTIMMAAAIAALVVGLGIEWITIGRK